MNFACESLVKPLILKLKLGFGASFYLKHRHEMDEVAMSLKSLLRRGTLTLVTACSLACAIATPTLSPANAQAAGGAPNQPLTLRADIQEANAVTGVITARGNVQIFYSTLR